MALQVSESHCLKLGVMTWMPHTVIQRSETSFKVTGSLVEVMNIVAEKLEVCMEYVLPQDMVFGAKLQNGSWSGVMGLLTRNDVDMSGTVLSQEAERAVDVDFSIPLYMDVVRLIYKRPILTSDIAGFIKPYTGFMWLLLGIAMVVLTTGICFVQHTQSRVFKEKRNKCSADILTNLWPSCQWIIGTSLAQSFPSLPTGLSVRILWGMWLLVSLIIGSVYRSNLKAMLILPKLRLPFDNLQELLKTDIQCLVADNSALHHVIESAPPESPLNGLRKQLVPTKDVLWATRELFLGRSAILSSEHLLNFVVHTNFRQTQTCPTYYASESFFGATSLSIAFPKGSPLKSKVDPILRSLREFGILEKLYRDEVQNVRECLKPATSNSLRPFDLGDFYGVFSVYLGGVLISLTVFFFEVAICPLKKQKERHGY